MTEDTKIPKIFHFMILGPNDFGMIHFLSIISAYKLNNPEHVYLYCEYNYNDNVYLEILKNELNDKLTVQLISDKYYKSNKMIKDYESISDILKLEVIIEKGGIIMSSDMLSIKPLDIFLDSNDVVICETDKKALSSAIIMAKPQHDLVKSWYNKINQTPFYNAKRDEISIKSLMQEYNLQLDNVRVENVKAFIPFTDQFHFMLREDRKHKENELANSYTVCVWYNSWYHTWLSKIDVEYFNTKDTLFVKYFGDYTKVICDHLNVIENLLNIYYDNRDYNKLFTYSKMYIDLCSRYNTDIDLIIPSYYKIAFDKLHEIKSDDIDRKVEKKSLYSRFFE